MLESIIADSPTLAAIVAVLGGAFLFLLLAAVLSNWRDRRRRNAAIREEPRFAQSHGEPDGALMLLPPPAPTPAPAPSAAARRGFGLAALTLAFVLGVAAGLAAMAVGRDEIAGGLARLAAIVGSGTDRAVVVATVDGGDAEPAGAPAVAPPPAPASNADVMARLADFAAGLEETLPRPAGPELSLTRVAVEGKTLNLGYGVGRVVPPDEVVSFKAYIDRTVRSLFCAREAREIRFLSDNGVNFHMTYVDPSGITVTELTVTPTFCA